MERASSILKSYPAHSKGGRSTNALLGTTNSDIQEKHLRRVTGYLRSLFEIRRWEKVCILLTGRSRWLGEWWGETKCRYCWDKNSIFHFSIKKKLFFPYWAEIVWLGIIPSCVLCKHTSLHTFLRALPQYILHFYTLSFAPSPSMQIVIEPKSFPLSILESLLARGQSFCEAASACLLLFFVPRSHIKAVFTGSLCHFFSDRM